MADEEFNREHPGAVIDPGDQASSLSPMRQPHPGQASIAASVLRQRSGRMSTGHLARVGMLGMLGTLDGERGASAVRPADVGLRLPLGQRHDA
jgi:hypothetical protein